VLRYRRSSFFCGQDPVAGFCEHGNEYSVSIKACNLSPGESVSTFKGRQRTVGVVNAS
jgi:hypothetical protein